MSGAIENIRAQIMPAAATAAIAAFIDVLGGIDIIQRQLVAFLPENMVGPAAVFAVVITADIVNRNLIQPNLSM